MFSTSRDVRRIDSRITADNYTFDTVKEFIYFGSAVTTKNDVSLEIKQRITLANRCYYGLNGQLSNRDLSRATVRIQSALCEVACEQKQSWFEDRHCKYVV